MKKVKIALFFLFIFSLLSSLLLVGCKKNEQKKEKEEKVIKIGAILPLTGNFSSYGVKAQRGILLGFEEWKPIVSRYKVKIIFEDNKSLVKEAVNEMKKLTSINNTPVIIGGLASSIALAIAPIAESTKTVLLCAFASSPRLITAGDYVFQIMPSDSFQAIILNKWFKKLGIKKVAIVYVASEWGEALKSTFEQNFKKDGGKIILEERCLESQKDFKAIVLKIRKYQNELDAIFAPTYPIEGSAFLKALREVKVNTPVFGADPWANGQIIQLARRSVENVRFVAPIQYKGKEYQNFKKKYIKRFNERPDLTAAAGYDSIKVILHVLNKIIKDGKKINGTTIKTYLYKVKNFRGATGITTFDENGSVISKEFGKYEVKNGKIVRIDRNN